MDKKRNSRIHKGIKTIENQLESIKNELIKLYVGTDANNDVTVNESLKELYDCTQKCCLFTRKFASNEILNLNEIQELFDKEIENSEIEITKLDNNVIKISMPIITPFVIYKKKKLYSKDSLTSREIDAIDRSDFMIDTLEKAIVKFLKENKIDRGIYENKTLIYANFFSSSYRKRLIPDTDNYSYKAFTDLITGYFTSSSDGALNTDIFLKTALGTDTHTEIYLIPKQFNSNNFEPK